MQVSGYNNAGTVEFLLDKDKNFYFLEVNARLQVEHPVTELISGVDLVHQQIKIAFGEKLAFTQEHLEQKGHAIECRIYAEDPSNNFLPSPGKVHFLKEPTGPGVRHDCGIYSGWDIPIYYDPILAKLIVWAESRDLACQRMIEALNDYVVLGVKTSNDFLKEVINHPKFLSGQTTTNFIAKHFSDWQEKDKPEEMEKMALIVAAFDSLNGLVGGAGHSTEPNSAYSPWLSLGKWRIGGNS